MCVRLVSGGAGASHTARGRPDNPFCALVAQTPGGAQACLRFQAAVEGHLAHKLAPHQARCFAGLTDVAVPVVVGGEHVATLLGGQVFRQKPTQEDFARVAKLLAAWGGDTDLRQLESTYFQTRTVSDQEFHAMVGLLRIFAQELADHANRWMIAERSAEPPGVKSAKLFVQAHVGDRLTMHEVAEHVHLSSWHFCKLFKKATGVHFTEYVRRVRVEKAKELLLNPHARITEVAFASGFQSVPHFNRVFKRCAGVTPTKYRAAQRG